MSKVVIKISKTTGEMTAQVVGVKGSGCLDVTKGIEKALGLVTADKKTEEFNELPPEQTERVRQ